MRDAGVESYEEPPDEPPTKTPVKIDTDSSAKRNGDDLRRARDVDRNYDPDKPTRWGWARMSRSAWNFGDGPKVLSYAATSFFVV